MLRAVPKHWFSSAYKVLEHNTAIAVIDPSWWREAGDLTINGARYRVYREGLMSGAFVLEQGSSILARAEKPSALYRSFLVEYDGVKYTLEAESVMYRKFALSVDGKQIGSVYPEHALTRKAVIDFPHEIALAVRIFMFWLVLIIWKREETTSGS